MKKSLSTLLNFLLAWALVIVIPHYQQQNSILSSLISSLVAYFAFVVIRNILEIETSPRNVSLVLLGTLSAYLAAVLLLFQGNETLYGYWSKFGAGSMVLNGALVPFGDLAQITSAINCATPLEVGVNICDPWGRLLNQNPDVVKMFNLLNFSNLNYVGVLSTILFFSLILFSIHHQQVNNLSIPVFLITPVCVLAIERANELITMILILGGLLLLSQGRRIMHPFGAILLGCAAIFKLWPIIIVFLTFFFAIRKRNILTKLLLLGPMLYWFMNLNLAKDALRSTQKGSPSGASFGARFFVDERIPRMLQGLYILIFTAVLVLLIRYFKQRSAYVEGLCNSHTEAAIICSTFIAYFSVWLVGQSFMYRFLLVLPALLVLVRPHNWRSQGTRLVVSLILVSAFTAKLQISIVLTSALAFTLLYLAIVLLGRWFNFSARMISRPLNISDS